MGFWEPVVWAICRQTCSTSLGITYQSGRTGIIPVSAGEKPRSDIRCCPAKELWAITTDGAPGAEPGSKI